MGQGTLGGRAFAHSRAMFSAFGWHALNCARTASICSKSPPSMRNRVGVFAGSGVVATTHETRGTALPTGGVLYDVKEPFCTRNTGDEKTERGGLMPAPGVPGKF